MKDDGSFQNWSDVLKRRAHLVHQQIGAMQRLVRDSGGSEAQMEQACAGAYRLLDQIYEQDLPIARALDQSDLLLHLEGEGLQLRNPGLSLVTGIMGDVRKEVGTMIKTLVSAVNEAIELPRGFELGLSSLARGSLYLGFCLPETSAEYAMLPGDPVFEASRQALATLGAITALCEGPDAYDSIRRDFVDPKIRDAALSAVGHLAPSGRRGVSSLAIAGRALPSGSWHTLTPQTRQRVRSWLDQPVLGDQVIELTGRVRAIDLDLRRFDLRRIDGGNLPDLRCIYSAAFDPPARGWLDSVVTVSGQVETYQGAARLLQVQTVVDRIETWSSKR